MLDEQGTVLFVNRNAEQTFGYAVEEMLGRSVTLLMPEGTSDRFQAALARYLATGQRGTSLEGRELPGRHKSGREVILDVSFGEFFDRKSRRRFVGVARDVSARKEAEMALATLSRRLLQVQEAERRHIAHELHDEAGQSLTALKMILHALPPADASALQVRLTASGLVDQVMQQVRTLSLELRPPMMDDLGLVAALRWHAKGVTERTGLPVLLEAGS